MSETGQIGTIDDATVDPEEARLRELSRALIAEHGEQNRRDAATRALAQTMAYDGDLTVPALIDGIRHYQRRTVEDCLALGVRLVLLREITPHGEWSGLMDRLGFAERTARRFMFAARKTAKSANLAVLAARQDSAGKMLELLVLDDDEAEILLDGGQIGQLALDDVDAMTPTELRRALREARETSAAQDRVLADKSAVIDRKDTEIAKLQSQAKTRVARADPDERRRAIEGVVMERSGHILCEAIPDLRLALDELRQASGDDIACTDLIRARVGSVLAAVQELAADYGADGGSGSVAATWAGFERWEAEQAALALAGADDDNARGLVIDGAALSGDDTQAG